MSTSAQPRDSDLEHVADLYATNFEVEDSEDRVVLEMGTLVPSIASTGQDASTEVRYHSRIRMGPGAARELYELLHARFGEDPQNE